MASPNEPIYTLQDVAHIYEEQPVLDIDQLSVFASEILALVGPSGAGKSTLLRLLAFLESPSRGELCYKGRRALMDEWPDLNVRRQVTMVFQRPLLLHRSVWDNVAYGLRLRGQKDKERVAAALEQVGLIHLAYRDASKLSGGEAQRVALARALVIRPQVLLLDEPTANLDPYNIKLIEEIVTQANQKQGVTVIIVTHNIFQARRLAHRAALLLNGRVVEVAAIQNFFDKPQTEEAAAFLRGDIIY